MAIFNSYVKLPEGKSKLRRKNGACCLTSVPQNPVAYPQPGRRIKTSLTARCSWKGVMKVMRKMRQLNHKERSM